MKITGRREHLARLSRMTSPDAAQTVGRALFVTGSAIAVDAAISITRGAVSGKYHVASRPGEAPNADTGQLDREIEVTQPSPTRVEVAAYSPHAVPLEFGTSKMEPRPFMRPAAEKNRAKGVAAVVAAVKRTTSG